MYFKALSASIILALSSAVVAADTKNDDEISIVVNKLSGLYASVGTVNFDPYTSAINSIGDSATFWKLGWEQHQNEWIWGAGMSVYLYSDKAKFSQETTQGTKESGASAINGYLEGGYKYEINDNFSLSIIAGYEQVFASSREIGQCYDCYGEDINISAGIYIQPRVSYLWDNDWYVSAAYSSYLSGDVENTMFLTVGVLHKFSCSLDFN